MAHYSSASGSWSAACRSWVSWSATSGQSKPVSSSQAAGSSGVALLEGHQSCIMSRCESAPGAEVSDEDDLSLTSQDYFEVANALKQKGGRKAASPETRARRAEERRQSRRAALRDAALAVPEKITVLESRVWTSYLTPWSKDGDGGHTALASRSAAECLIAGYNESLEHDVAVRTSGSKHVLTGVNPSLSDTRIVSICADPKCRYTFAFTTEPPKKADKDGRWHLEKFTPHSARCAVPARARARKCHYSGEQLAAVLLESEPEDIFAVEPKAAKRLLNPYIVAKPDDDLQQRAGRARAAPTTASGAGPSPSRSRRACPARSPSIRRSVRIHHSDRAAPGSRRRPRRTRRPSP